MRVGLASRLGAAPSVAGAGVALGVLAVVAVAWRFGPTAGMGVGGGLLVALVLISDARAAVTAYVLAVVLAEPEGWGVDFLDPFYDSVVAFVAPVDLLAVLAVAAVALDRLSAGARIAMPRAYLVPFALYVVALASGTITGLFGGSADFAVIGEWQTFAHLLVAALLVAHVVAGTSTSAAAVLPALGVAVLKALAGLAVVFSGLAPGDPPLTYYGATGNWVVLVAVVGVVAAVLSSAVRRTWGLVVLVPLVASLALSYRRSFWIAALLCLALVVMIASGRTGRRLLVPATALAALAALATYAVLFTGLASGLQGPLAERARSLDPAEIAANDEDRYRLDERRNVVADLRRSPLLGLGVGSEWTARYPVGPEFDFARAYVHVAALWHWLKMGLAGLAAYLALLTAAVAVGWRVWRAHPHALVRCGGLAVALGFLGLGAVELSATFVGTDLRMSVVLGAALGWLAVAHREAGSPALSREGAAAEDCR